MKTSIGINTASSESPRVLISITATSGQQVFGSLPRPVNENLDSVFYNGVLIYSGVTFNSSSEIDIGFEANEGDVITIK